MIRYAIAFAALGLLAAPAVAVAQTVVYEPTRSVMDGPALPVLLVALVAVLLAGDN